MEDQMEGISKSILNIGVGSLLLLSAACGGKDPVIPSHSPAVTAANTSGQCTEAFLADLKELDNAVNEVAVYGDRNAEPAKIARSKVETFGQKYKSSKCTAVIENQNLMVDVDERVKHMLSLLDQVGTVQPGTPSE